MTVLFTEEQAFGRGWGYLVVGVAVVGLLAFLPVALAAGDPVAVAAMAAGPLIALLVAWLIWSARLVTEVTPREIRVGFTRMFGRRTIPIASIRRHEVRTYSAVRDLGGRGVRIGVRGGVSYSARGDRGVELELAGGKLVLIGSERADELAAAIARARRA